MYERFVCASVGVVNVCATVLVRRVVDLDALSRRAGCLGVFGFGTGLTLSKVSLGKLLASSSKVDADSAPVRVLCGMVNSLSDDTQTAHRHAVVAACTEALMGPSGQSLSSVLLPPLLVQRNLQTELDETTIGSMLRCFVAGSAWGGKVENMCQQAVLSFVQTILETRSRASVHKLLSVLLEPSPVEMSTEMAT